MKNVLTNRFVAIVLSIALSITLTSTASANDGDKNGDNNIAAKVDLNFIGQLNNQPVFQLTLENVINSQDYIVSVEDDNSYVFHKSALKAGTTSVNFVLSEDVENVPLRFSIYDKTSHKTYTYEVNQKPVVVEENSYMITKL